MPSLGTEETPGEFVPGETAENILAEFGYPGKVPRHPKVNDEIRSQEAGIKAKLIDSWPDILTADDVDGETEHDAAVAKMTQDEAIAYAMVTAARIEEDIRYKSQVWEDFSEEERLVAASASPTALMAELGAQIGNATVADTQEYACKASAKRKKTVPTSKPPGGKGNQPMAAPAPTTGAPSMWKSGAVKSKRPSTLCVPAACVLMGMLYTDGQMRLATPYTKSSDLFASMGFRM